MNSSEILTNLANFGKKKATTRRVRRAAGRRVRRALRPPGLEEPAAPVLRADAESTAPDGGGGKERLEKKKSILEMKNSAIFEQKVEH